MNDILKKIHANREKRKIYGIIMLVFSIIFFQISNFIFIRFLKFDVIFGIIWLISGLVIFIFGLYLIFYIPHIKEITL